MFCIVRGCNNKIIDNISILEEAVCYCEEHNDAIWLLFRNAKTDIDNIIEELHWNCRNLEELKEGGDGDQDKPQTQ